MPDWILPVFSAFSVTAYLVALSALWMARRVDSGATRIIRRLAEAEHYAGAVRDSRERALHPLSNFNDQITGGSI